MSDPMLDTTKVAFSPKMQGAREFIGKEVAMAVGAAVAETNRAWLASLPKCKDCGSPATQDAGDFGSHPFVGPFPKPVCDEHGKPGDDGQSFQDRSYAPLVRALTPRRAT